MEGPLKKQEATLIGIRMTGQVDGCPRLTMFFVEDGFRLSYYSWAIHVDGDLAKCLTLLRWSVFTCFDAFFVYLTTHAFSTIKETFQHLQLNFGTWDQLGLPGPILRGADLVAKLNALETHQEMQSRLGGPDIGCNGRGP